VDKGLDYAWHGTINWDCFRNSGVRFIMRYFSYDSSKDLTGSELAQANAEGIAVGVVWETTANRMLGGWNAGVSDAQEADRRADALGMHGIPLYFACDWDAAENEQAAINGYMDGVISVIGKQRAGMYAGYWPLKRAWDAGKVTYGWQTYAWSGGNWDSRAQLRQVQNGVTVCGTSADWDESHADDFGQWPRPAQNVPVTEGTMMSSASQRWGSMRYYACVWEDGKINFKEGDSGNWFAVDATQAPVRSGVDLDIDDEGAVTLTYTNGYGEVCVYERKPGGGSWGWKSLKGKAL
jgi:hypothetical protein